MSDRTLSQDLAELAAADTGQPGLDVASAVLCRCADQVAELEQRLDIAERRLAALNRHRDGIHDSAACFELPLPDWCYSVLGSKLGRFGPAERLADALEIADHVRAAGGGDAEVEAALDEEMTKAALQILAAQERGETNEHTAN